MVFLTDITIKLTSSADSRITGGSHELIALCFEKLGLEEVHGYCALNNPASAHVLEKLGMTELEHIPNDKILNGQSITSQHFVITKTKWQEIQK